MRKMILVSCVLLLPSMSCGQPSEQYQLGYLKALEAPMLPGLLGGPTEDMWANVLIEGLIRNRVGMWNDIDEDGSNDTSELINTAIQHYGARNIAKGFGAVLD
ncbi:MAG: hypothetical protein ACWA40_05570 [Planktomarina sp.]